MEAKLAAGLLLLINCGGRRPGYKGEGGEKKQGGVYVHFLETRKNAHRDIKGYKGERGEGARRCFCSFSGKRHC